MLHRLIFAGLLLFMTTAASAHGNGQHVLGTVTAIDEQHMEIKTPKGAMVSVQLNKETRFKSKRKPRSTEPPAVGDRVVVEATMDDKKTLTAKEVHYASASRVPQPVPTPAPSTASTPDPSMNPLESAPPQ